MVSAVDAEDARQLDEGLRRRAADQELRDELARHDFAGPQYRRFQEELARYGTAVLRAWMHSGYVFKLTASRGFSLFPTDAELEELHQDSDARDDLANMTVAVALPQFRDRALAGGGWRAEGGAALPTYFMGACLYVFPNEFRKRRVQDEKSRRQDRLDPAVALTEKERRIDPAAEATGNIYVADRIRSADPRAQAVVALTVDGWSQEEIAELLGKRSVRAVEGTLYRWRTKRKPPRKRR
jgi:DNA-directed RNA polymerase specialized sigma24 family protein